MVKQHVGIFGLSVDDKYVYFADDTTLWYAPKEGSGTPQAIDARTTNHSCGAHVSIVLDGARLVWAFCLPGTIRQTARPQ